MSDNDSPDLLYSYPEARDYLARHGLPIGRDKFREYLRRGIIAHIPGAGNIGGRVPKRALDEFLQRMIADAEDQRRLAGQKSRRKRGAA